MSPAESQPEKLCFGAAGFVVLDIVEPSRGHPGIYLHFGGTTGNVAMILGALGWQSYPFARLPQDDPAFPVLAEDLSRFGVHPNFVALTPAGPLPALVQRKRADGSDQPLFTFRCPRCSSRWRGWSAITEKSATEILDRLPRFRFFLIDRYTRGNLTLATRAKQDGASVVFEPASLTANKQAELKRFQEALDMADMVKYSAHQFPELADMDFPRRPAVEIQTMGNEGLRFRRRLPDHRMSAWASLAAVLNFTI